ncbi:MAG: iron-containing alcohol dehydrogenase, partial [Candidatus Hydrogenedentes bacterium]|nr:iron-containing alcohol dehydrogenase [Candidatus Hydrogenedentota bacterium]
LGGILTLPASGSESNGNAVISRNSTHEKLAFSSEKVYPRFAILDPETTFTLPPRQTANGIIDAFIHVMEQYMTYPVNAPLQDRQAEAILLTLVEEGPKALANPMDYGARANIMWAATQALNGLIACGVPQDWSTHAIGHELTALFGLDHAQTLAIVFPGMLRYRRKQKGPKILQYAKRVWDITEGSEEKRIDAAIEKTEDFFRSLDVKTRLREYDITEGYEEVARRFAARGRTLGELGDIGPAEIDAILALCVA